MSLSNHGLGWKSILSHINIVLVVYFHQCFPSTSFPSLILITFHSNYIWSMSQKQQMRIFVLLFVYLYLWKLTYILGYIPTYILHFTFAMYYLCFCLFFYLNWSDFPYYFKILFSCLRVYLYIFKIKCWLLKRLKLILQLENIKVWRYLFLLKN